MESALRFSVPLESAAQVKASRFEELFAGSASTGGGRSFDAGVAERIATASFAELIGGGITLFGILEIIDGLRYGLDHNTGWGIMISGVLNVMIGIMVMRGIIGPLEGAAAAAAVFLVTGAASTF